MLQTQLYTQDNMRLSGDNSHVTPLFAIVLQLGRDATRQWLQSNIKGTAIQYPIQLLYQYHFRLLYIVINTIIDHCLATCKYTLIYGRKNTAEPMCAYFQGTLIIGVRLFLGVYSSFQCQQVVVATLQFRCSQLLVISYNVY